MNNEKKQQKASENPLNPGRHFFYSDANSDFKRPVPRLNLTSTSQPISLSRHDESLQEPPLPPLSIQIPLPSPPPSLQVNNEMTHSDDKTPTRKLLFHRTRAFFKSDACDSDLTDEEADQKNSIGSSSKQHG